MSEYIICVVFDASFKELSSCSIRSFIYLYNGLSFFITLSYQVRAYIMAKFCLSNGRLNQSENLESGNISQTLREELIFSRLSVIKHVTFFFILV